MAGRRLNSGSLADTLGAIAAVAHMEFLPTCMSSRDRRPCTRTEPFYLRRLLESLGDRIAHTRAGPTSDTEGRVHPKLRSDWDWDKVLLGFVKRPAGSN